MARALDRPFIPLDRLEGTRFDLMVNTTPVGMYPLVHANPLPGYRFHGTEVVMDIVYNPRTTNLLRTAASRGCATVDGLQMFMYQAAEQFTLWTGMNPPVHAMMNAALCELEKSHD